jgi:Flp pilus assembly protein TadB
MFIRLAKSWPSITSMQKKRFKVEILPLISSWFPKLEDELEGAKVKYNAHDWIKRSLNMGLFSVISFTVLGFMVLETMEKSLLWLPLIMAGSFIFGFLFAINMPKVYRQHEENKIDKDLLFAGQYLLIKMNSGEPLFNSLMGVSKSYGETGRAFSDVVEDVHFGAPIEKAIDRMVNITPSRNFKRILWEISNTMKTGADVRKSLRSILKQMHDEFIIKIEAYGKKLNTVTMLYMVIAVILPSLGMTLFVIIASFIGISLPNTVLYFIIFMLGVLQFFFISIFRSIRPAVEL